MKARTWNQRAFVVDGAVISGLALPLTGIADHVAGDSAPNALVGWAIVHTAAGILFVTFCTWHIVLNRRALLRYLRGKVPAGFVPTRETIAALALVGAVLAVTVVHALVEA